MPVPTVLPGCHRRLVLTEALISGIDDPRD
jgi:hypothetical protein